MFFYHHLRFWLNLYRKVIQSDIFVIIEGFHDYPSIEKIIVLAECHKPCLNGGKCIKKDTCSCLRDFDGLQCENDLRTRKFYT